MTVALHAEWTKWRTLPGQAWLILGIIAVTIGVSYAAIATQHCPAVGGCISDPVKQSLAGVEAGQAVIAILAVLAITGEYANGMIRVTLSAIPRRLVMLTAKTSVVLALVLAVGAVSVLGCVLAGRLVLPGHGFTPAHGYAAYSLGSSTLLRAACGAVLYLVLVALMSIGVATAVRESAVAIGVVLGLLYLFPILLLAVSNTTWHRHLEQIAPMIAGLDIISTTGLKSLSLTPWQGLGVMAAWAAGCLLLGGTLLRLRDA